MGGAPASLLSSESTAWTSALMRRWQGTDSVMEQPPLDHHYLVMHLGGSKKVVRTLDGPTRSAVVDRGSLTFVPAGTSFRWETTGPIAFAHLYILPWQIERAVEQDTGRDGRSASLLDAIGTRDTVIEPLLVRMLRELERGPDASALLLDSAYQCILKRLATRHSSAGIVTTAAALLLAPHRLRRVLDYVEENFASSVDLATLAEIAGTSPSHFCHGFRGAMGVSPYQYVLRRRVNEAKVLLLTSGHTLEEIGAACGFTSRHHFSHTFKAIETVGPKRFRMCNGGVHPVGMDAAV